MYFRTRLKRNKWQFRGIVLTATYRIWAFTIASIQISLFPPDRYSVLPPVILLTSVGAYTLATILILFRRSPGDVVSYSLIGIDMAVGILLVTLTGGLYSPFLVYALAPVLTSAIFLDSKLTFVLAFLSAIYVIVCHLITPFFSNKLDVFAFGILVTFTIAVGLTACLPYLVNSNLRSRLKYNSMLTERKRLSREIHDGAAQSVAALSWQIHVLRQRLAEMNCDISEVCELEDLAQKAQQDVRESLELLRTYTGNGSFLPDIKEYVEHLKKDSDINFDMDINLDTVGIESADELELLRICQEVLTNIRKHADAHNVHIAVKSEKSNVQVTIVDDGRGFDGMTSLNNEAKVKGHGLDVMRERAKSIGGELRVWSMPGRGTEIQVEVPLQSSRRIAWLRR